MVAEEAVSRGEIPVIGREFILVDPLDGTREFLSRNGEYTVNIALVRDGSPCCGAVYAPALARLWVGGTIARTVEVGPDGALPAADRWRPIKVRTAPTDGLTALVSRSHSDAQTEAWLARLPVGTRREAGSSLKFCVLAQGDADVYPRLGPTMEWDIAAGHAVLPPPAARSDRRRHLFALWQGRAGIQESRLHRLRRSAAAEWVRA